MNTIRTLSGVPRLILLAALIALASAPAALAIEVVAEGQAFSEKQAILNAQRNAVEQGLGLFLDSSTKIKNFKLIQDRVLSSSSGFVTSYEVVSITRTADGREVRVKIKATVARDLLKNRLMALKILHQATGRKRVMVIYKSSNPNALARNHGANRTALQAIRQALNREGFQVFNESVTAKVYRRIERAARVDRPVEDVIAMALDQKANLLVIFENIAGQRGAKGGLFSKTDSTIRISVHETSNGRQVADAEAEGIQLILANPGGKDWEKGLSSAAGKAARTAISKIIDQIIVYYRDLKQEGFNYTITFRNFNDIEIDKIVSVLENSPDFSQLTNPKFTRDYMEVGITSTQPSLRVDRILRSGMLEKGITLRREFIEGYTMIYSNPNRRE
ncbi:MAG: hypothetical protein IIC13_18405 [SAR324 cluster bacterium]|nr:hypothetical protein [SAR324 cluster bacterium]